MRNVEADAHAVETSWETDRPGGEDLCLQGGDVVGVDQLVRHRGDGVLPDQLLLRDQRPEVALDRPHVDVRQLEPRPGERVRQLVRVLQEAPRDRLVDRVEPQREVRRQDRRVVSLRRIVGVRHGAGPGAAPRNPLPQAGGAQFHVPLEAEQVLEEAVVPPRRRGCPGPLEPAGDGVRALPGAVAAPPAQALLLDRGALGLRAEILVRVGHAVGLAERVPADDQRDGLLVVHRHAPEGLADVAGRRDRVRDGVRALRVDVDEAHLVGGQRALQRPDTAVALVAEPGAFGAPVDVLVGLPDVRAAAGEAEGREAHRLQGTIAREDHQVGPGDLAAVLLLDRPQQPARLVEVAIVRPAVERREALHAGGRSAAAVVDPVRAGAVPRHPDHERPVVAEVGGPPLLRGGQHLVDVLCQGIEVEGLELRGVVEVLTHGVGRGRVLPEDLQIELVRPPVAVACDPGRATAGRGRGREAEAARAPIVPLAGLNPMYIHHGGEPPLVQRRTFPP